ncbi:hypothetical protein GOP47_0006552 [Adiantum capillus-veneris]|uniref:Uncharacterized protein n=1 Tax=Adiantum capillus-veneris TaxID=13818 RepID=A0A9D4ZML2_ADICA|nr:hypothetical protein GOP47_0030988 [Adiantum capillus-veneris]KAI5078881.1 hypothetical protein GOP47_0006552 [Adiantum capillus-veneris]
MQEALGFGCRETPGSGLRLLQLAMIGEGTSDTAVLLYQGFAVACPPCKGKSLARDDLLLLCGGVLPNLVLWRMELWIYFFVRTVMWWCWFASGLWHSALWQFQFMLGLRLRLVVSCDGRVVARDGAVDPLTVGLLRCGSCGCGP